MNWNIAWHRVIKYLEIENDIIESIYYTGVKKNDDKMRNYLKYLDKISLKTVTKSLKEIQSENGVLYKSNFDVEITSDMAFDRNNVDQFILFSGDSDFDYIVKKLQSVGKKVICYASRKTLAWELKLSVDQYYFLEDFQEQFCR